MLNTDLLLPFDKDRIKTAIPIYGLHTSDLNDDGDAITNLPDSLQQMISANGFTANVGAVLATRDGVLLGLGDGNDPFAYAAGADKLPEGLYALNTTLKPNKAHLAALGWLLGSYRFNRYKKQAAAKACLMAPEGVDIAAVVNAADATGYVRDLVNTPAGDMQPTDLEKETRDLAERHGATVEVLFDDQLLLKNFPLVHAVGRAALDRPRLIDLRWQPVHEATALKKVTLVGKGVCFDSGGLNLKGANGMALMKKDMGGAAHALGLAKMIMAAKLPLELRVLLPVVENAVSGSAFRPGDILKARNGLTVEIGNTDAEGRLILADALTYACEEKPDILISLATLTGAARVALGPEVIPFYSDHDELVQAITDASRRHFDPAWHLPMWPRYESMLKSPIADMNNISGNSFAGSIIAALFLKRFVQESVPWAHFDIYAWRPTSEPGRPAGGEAQCIRALFAILEQQNHSV